MTSGAETLRKMMRGAKNSGADDEARLGDALGLALGKVTRAMFDAAGGIGAVSFKTLGRDDLLKAPPDPALLILLETPDGQSGLMWFDAVLVNALVEMMTSAPDNMVYREARLPTLIDAALCRDFARALLRELPRALAPEGAQSGAFQLDYGRHETDPRKLTYDLADAAHGLISGEVQFQDGIRGGPMAIALPAGLWQNSPATSAAADAGTWRAQLAQNVAEAPLALVAELDVVSMPVARAIALKPGDIVPISGASLSDLTLLTPEGVRLLKGRLGQKDGNKAVSLTRGAPGVTLTATLPDPWAAGPDAALSDGDPAPLGEPLDIAAPLDTSLPLDLAPPPIGPGDPAVD